MKAHSLIVRLAICLTRAHINDALAVRCLRVAQHAQGTKHVDFDDFVWISRFPRCIRRNDRSMHDELDIEFAEESVQSSPVTYIAGHDFDFRVMTGYDFLGC